MAVSVFNKFNSLVSDSGVDNKLRLNGLRSIFEEVLKEKLNIDPSQYETLNNLFSWYLDEFNATGIRYSGFDLIKVLNKFSHSTPDDLPDIEFQKHSKVLNKLLENILEQKNTIDSNSNEKLSGSTLNADQQLAVDSNSNITIVNAGPGTGKTHLISERIIRKSNENNGIIIGLSYTNTAAQELKERVASLILESESNSILNKDIVIGTIHSIALHFSKQYHEDLLKVPFDYSVIDDQEYQELLDFYDDDKPLAQDYLRTNKLLRFDEILELFLKLLQEDAFLKMVSDNISEIVIDESQDLDSQQYEIFHLLYYNSENLSMFFVGDQRQNIFSFRGGSLENFRSCFKKEEVNEIILKQSYRCPNEIFKLVNGIKFTDCPNPPLYSELNRNSPVQYFEEANKEAESREIVSYINGKIAQGMTFSSISILSSSSFYFKEIGAELNAQNYPFKMFGGTSHLEQHIKLVCNLTNTIQNQNKHSLRRIARYWSSAISMSSGDFNQLLNELQKSTLQPIKLIYEFVLARIDTTVSFIEILTEFSLMCEQKKLLVQEYIDDINDFIKLCAQEEVDSIDEILLRLTPNSDVFGKFYIRASGIQCSTEIMDNNYLSLSTIHSAKGKEWDYVIMVGMTEGIFPMYKANINSELKKFYVGCTRAKHELIFTRPKEYSIPKKTGIGEYVFKNNPSQFIESIL